MSGLSLYGRSQMLAAYFTPDVFAAPDVLYLALSTAIPTPGDTGTDLLEPADPVYSRVAYGLGSAWWVLTGGGQVINTQEAPFGVPGADWGTLTGWALCTDIQGGDLVFHGALDTPVQVVAGPDAYVVAGVGALVVTQQ